jgi:hypothetical protein
MVPPKDHRKLDGEANVAEAPAGVIGPTDDADRFNPLDARSALVSAY